MNRRLRVIGPLLAAGLATGCAISIGGGDGSKPRQEVPKPPPPPVVVVPAGTEDSATLAEIDAVTKLGFDAGKVQALKNVAQRPSLSPAAQVHLVNTTLRTLSFDAGKVDVLQALIQNPGFAAAGREAILRQIERLDFDASRAGILSAIQSRPMP